MIKTTFRHLLSFLVALAAVAAAMSTAHAQQCAPADFNRDGKSDVFWRNGSTGQTVEWQMNALSILNAGRQRRSPIRTGRSSATGISTAMARPTCSGGTTRPARR